MNKNAEASGHLDISCIFLTWNSAEYVEKCISSVDNDLQKSGFTYELIIIDNGSSDGTLELLAGLSPFVTVIPLGRNTGTTFSRNIGLRSARGEIIAVLDSDVEVTEVSTFERLVAYLKDHPKTGLVVPRLFYPSGQHQKSTDYFPTLTMKVKRFFHLRQIEKDEASAFADRELAPSEVDYAISAFWVFPRDIVDSVGVLDEKIFYSPEDVDYCLRIWFSGRPVVLEPRVTAVHHAQEISRRSLFSKSSRSHIAGLSYYFLKFRYLFSSAKLYRRINANQR